MLSQKITLDFCHNDYKTVTVKQYDKDSRSLIITCTNNGSIRKLDPITYECNVKMYTPSNRSLYKPATINEDGTVLIVFDEDMVHDGGTGKLEIQILDQVAKKTLSTMILTVVIVSSVYPDDVIIASEEFSALTKALLSIDDSAKKAEETVELANETIDRIEELESNVDAAEDSRVIAEQNRDIAEDERSSSENTRKQNELQRNEAENSRAAEFDALKTEIDIELTKLETANIEAIVEEDSYKVKVTDRNGEFTTSENLYNSLTIGTVETGDSDENPAANITGKFGEQKLNLRLPSGKPFKISATYTSVAEMEADIDNIEKYTFIMIHTGNVEDEDTGKLYMKDTNGMVFITDLSGVQGIQGVKGETGATPNLTIGTVETGEPGTNVSVTITGTAEKPVINFVIPRGDTGNVENVYAGSIPYESASDENTVKDVVDNLQEYVESLEIVQTTSTALSNSYEGGIKINKIDGASKQENTTGAQLFDGLLEQGSLNSDGSNNSTTYAIRSINYIEVDGGSTITLSNDKNYANYIYEYDENKLFITYTGVTTDNTLVLNDSTRFIRFRSATSSAENDLTANYMLNVGDTALPWEPYTNRIASPSPDYPQEIESVVVGKIKTVGKNLLASSKVVEKTINGVTFTPVRDADGKLLYIEANGTATDMAWIGIGVSLEAGEYIANGVSGGSNSTYYIFGMTADDWQYAFGNTSNGDKKFMFDRTRLISYRMSIASGATANGVKFYPMIRKADVTDDTYEPYQESAITLSNPITLHGIGDVKDRIVQNDGIWGIERYIGEITSYNNEEITGEYLSTTGNLDVGANVFYILAGSTFETLPIVDQIALHGLKSFDTVTYINTDSEIKPVIELEYGTSKVGALTLENYNLTQQLNISDPIGYTDAQIDIVNDNLALKVSIIDMSSSAESRADKPWFVLKDYVTNGVVSSGSHKGCIYCGSTYSYEGYLDINGTYGSWAIHGSDGLVCHAYLSSGAWYYPQLALQEDIDTINNSLDEIKESMLYIVSFDSETGTLVTKSSSYTG